MITWVRTADIREGKNMVAIEWALKIAAYVNETFKTNVSLQRNVTGQVNRLHWVATYQSLASFEELMAKLIQDEGYQQLLAESAELELFFASSIVDNLYQSIP